MKMEVLVMSLVFSLPVSTTSYCGSHEQGSPFFVHFSVTSFLVVVFLPCFLIRLSLILAWPHCICYLILSLVHALFALLHQEETKKKRGQTKNLQKF